MFDANKSRVTPGNHLLSQLVMDIDMHFISLDEYDAELYNTLGSST